MVARPAQPAATHAAKRKRGSTPPPARATTLVDVPPAAQSAAALKPTTGPGGNALGRSGAIQQPPEGEPGTAGILSTRSALQQQMEKIRLITVNMPEALAMPQPKRTWQT